MRIIRIYPLCGGRLFNVCRQWSCLSCWWNRGMQVNRCFFQLIVSKLLYMFQDPDVFISGDRLQLVLEEEFLNLLLGSNHYHLTEVMVFLVAGASDSQSKQWLNVSRHRRYLVALDSVARILWGILGFAWRLMVTKCVYRFHSVSPVGTPTHVVKVPVVHEKKKKTPRVVVTSAPASRHRFWTLDNSVSSKPSSQQLASAGSQVNCVMCRLPLTPEQRWLCLE